MYIWHRVSFHSEDQVDAILDRHGIPYEVSPLPHQDHLSHISITEDDPNWPLVRALIEERSGVNIYDTFFPPEDVLAAEWSRLIVYYERHYPQPESTWKKRTYRSVCPGCGVTGEQVQPLRVKKEPRMKNNDFLILLGTHKALARLEVFETLIDMSLSGVDSLPVMLYREDRPSEMVRQFRFPYVAAPGLTGEDRIEPEACPTCGVTKYAYHQRGYMHLAQTALRDDVDAQLTSEWFGSGQAGAWREILVSRRLARIILEQGWQGVRFKPIQIV